MNWSNELNPSPPPTAEDFRRIMREILKGPFHPQPPPPMPPNYEEVLRALFDEEE